MGTVAKQSFLNSINSYLGVGLGALNTMILFPRIFSPDTYGDFQSLMAIITIVATFAHLGFPTSVVVFFPKLSAQKQRAYWSYMLVGISLISISLGLSLLLIQQMEWAIIPNADYGFLVCISIVYFELFSALSQHHSKVVLPQFVRNVFRRAIITLGLILSFYFGGDAIFYLIFGLGYLIHLALVILYARPDLPQFKWQPKLVEQRKTLSYGLMVMLAMGSIMLVTRIDILMIRSLLGAPEVAFYSIAFFIGTVVAVPVKSLIASIRPFVAKAWAREDYSEIDKLYKKSALNQLAVTGFIFLFLWMNLDLFLLILPHEYHFTSFQIVFFYIGLSEVVKGATGINGMILTVSEKQRYNFYSGLVLLALTVLGNWLLIPYLGLSGAALASLLALSLFNFFKLYLVKRFYGLLPGSRSLLLLSISLILGLLVLSFLKESDYNLTLKLLLGNTFTLILLAALFRYSKVLNDFKVFKFLRG